MWAREADASSNPSSAYLQSLGQLSSHLRGKQGIRNGKKGCCGRVQA